MAATMGFSSFGSKPHPPKKKQKMSLEDQSNSTGTNSTPLGVRSRGLVGEKQQKPIAQREEGVEGDGAGKGLTGSVPFVKPSIHADGNTTSVQHNEEGSGNPILAPSPNDGMNERQQVGNDSVTGGFLGDNMLLPVNREGLVEMRPEPGKRADGTWDWQALRRGVRDERGDTAFYDASFVEDPWKDLRQHETG